MPDPPPMPRLDDRQLASCVQALKERERSVVVMTFYDEQTSAETARVSRDLGGERSRHPPSRHPATARLYGSHAVTTPYAVATSIVRTPSRRPFSWTTGSLPCPPRLRNASSST